MRIFLHLNKVRLEQNLFSLSKYLSRIFLLSNERPEYLTKSSVSEFILFPTNTTFGASLGIQKRAAPLQSRFQKLFYFKDLIQIFFFCLAKRKPSISILRYSFVIGFSCRCSAFDFCNLSSKKETQKLDIYYFSSSSNECYIK